MDRLDEILKQPSFNEPREVVTAVLLSDPGSQAKHDAMERVYAKAEKATQEAAEAFMQGYFPPLRLYSLYINPAQSDEAKDANLKRLNYTSARLFVEDASRRMDTSVAAVYGNLAAAKYYLVELALLPTERLHPAFSNATRLWTQLLKDRPKAEQLDILLRAKRLAVDAAGLATPFTARHLRKLHQQLTATAVPEQVREPAAEELPARSSPAGPSNRQQQEAGVAAPGQDGQQLELEVGLGARPPIASAGQGADDASAAAAAAAAPLPEQAPPSAGGAGEDLEGPPTALGVGAQAAPPAVASPARAATRLYANVEDTAVVHGECAICYKDDVALFLWGCVCPMHILCWECKNEPSVANCPWCRRERQDVPQTMHGEGQRAAGRSGQEGRRRGGAIDSPVSSSGAADPSWQGRSPQPRRRSLRKARLPRLDLQEPTDEDSDMQVALLQPHHHHQPQLQAGRAAANGQLQRLTVSLSD